MFHKNWLECIINDIWGRNYSRRETEGETIVSLDEVPSPNNVRDSSRCLLVRFKSYWLPKVSRLLTLIQSIDGRRGGKKSISKQKKWYGLIYKFCKNFEWWWQKNRWWWQTYTNENIARIRTVGFFEFPIPNFKTSCILYFLMTQFQTILSHRKSFKALNSL